METEQTDFQEIVERISDLKYVHMNDTTFSIEDSFINDLEWLLEIVNFTKSFVGFTYNLNESPIHKTENETYKIVEEYPFLIYKDEIKLRYKKIMYLMKNVYRNALKLPDLEKIYYTIEKEFNNYNHIHLKNPEYIFEHFVYNVCSYTHIQENYTSSMQCIKVFEYLYYMLINHIKELEFDADSIKPPSY